MRLIVMILMHLLVASSLAAGPIESRIITSTLTLPQSLEANSSSWCTWTSCTIGPRLYLASRSDGSYLVGWTDNFGNGHVSKVSGSSITSTHNYTGSRIRGLVAHDDGSYAVLLKNGATLSLSSRAANGSETWTTNLNSTIAQDSSPLGGHRLAYGGEIYAAYWAVHGIAGIYDGHEGDQLTFVDDSGVIQAGGWNWGCSHSMAELVGYHTDDSVFTVFCSKGARHCFAELWRLWLLARNKRCQALLCRTMALMAPRSRRDPGFRRLPQNQDLTPDGLFLSGSTCSPRPSTFQPHGRAH